ncbi:sulfotransferase family protein [Flavisphingomonas formosensis]|uniref:sulfotransferase family protein n=1 Tax=Flavisphingomonas formosensis TaxID=861534 RepID=UPI0012F9C3C4|nr:sulfotransferase [Sphingomonas formosensis]
MAAQAKTIIDDMREPRLSELQAGALAAAAAHPVTITAESVLEAARAETGLSDFGDPGFRVRLETWVASIDAETDLTALARAGTYADMVRFAANRLRVEDAIARHPEILDIVIDRPLIVAGLPRSGTTYLQNFLGADDRLRSLPYWEALRPVPAGPDETGDPATDPRYAKAAEAWAQMDAMLPYVKAVHPFDPDHISEDIELQCIDFGSYYLEWGVPNHVWTDYYWNTDQTPVYRYMKRVLQVLTWFKGPNRWLLKCPQHMEQLPALKTVFPDATFVINHRDPIGSIASAVTSLAYSSRVRVDRVDPGALAAYWIPRYEKLLRACVRDRDAIPESQSEDVYFHELLADPMGIVARIYAKAGLPIDDRLRGRWQAFLQDNQRGKHGALDNDLRRDFGLDPAEVRRRFQFYFDRFPVQVEVK